jgi:transposase-like protein
VAAHELEAAEMRRRWDAYVANGRTVGKSASALGLQYGTMSSWLTRIRTDLKSAGLKEPTEAFWASLEKPDPIIQAPASQRTSADAIRLARLEQQVRTLKAERDEAVKAAVEAEDLRASVFGLAGALEPIAFDATAPAEKGDEGETVVVFLSDLHWGERIDLGGMDGVNSYNLKIAGARLMRAFQAIIDLSTRHWPGKPPERLILILGGDLVSGDIHLELSKTNALSAIPAVRDLVGHLAAGLKLLHRALDCPIDVISIPGNHGRSTLKPESKNAVETSYDTLVADFLESQFAAEKRLTFYTPASGDALFSVYGHQVLATHGDKIGSRGGQGFIGPAATAARGFKKLVMDYAGRGIHLDLILCGHFHTALQLEEGLVNGCLSGISEYGRDARFRPKPATQLFLSLHPRRGVTQVRWLQVGTPDEGSIYAPRVASSPRPRYRVNAVMRAV